MIEAAAEAGVKRIIYVSSIAALDYSRLPTKESYGYNPDRYIYYNSDGEQLAFQLAKAQHRIGCCFAISNDWQHGIRTLKRIIQHS
jgi:dihydroflavonol-4-reductase